jgi:uncharacterized surface protein with fasciclin (FAS1) repeats
MLSHKGNLELLLPKFQNKIKDLMTKTIYKFNTIQQIDDDVFAVFYRNLRKQGRVCYMFMGPEVWSEMAAQLADLQSKYGEISKTYALLQQKDTMLEQKDADLEQKDAELIRSIEQKNTELLKKVEVLESKCDNVEDAMFPSVVDISIQNGRFDLLRDALIKANNQDLFVLFKNLERQFAAVDNEFNLKPERYTAFAITQETSKILVDNFIIGADGNPITDPDIQSLKQIMEYHIVRGELTPEDIRRDQNLTSYNGLRLKIRVKGKDVFVNNSKILTPEGIEATNGIGIEATNGIVYLIDNILNPLDGINLIGIDEAEALPAPTVEGGADLAGLEEGGADLTVQVEEGVARLS